MSTIHPSVEEKLNALMNEIVRVGGEPLGFFFSYTVAEAPVDRHVAWMASGLGPEDSTELKRQIHAFLQATQAHYRSGPHVRRERVNGWRER